MKILLLGKNGQVGWELQRSLAPLGEVVALDRRGDAGLCGDLGTPDALATTVRSVRPDVIVNAAAHTAVDKAESEPDLARAINATAPAVLAAEAASLGAWLVHFSTDYVFDGSGTRPWHEDDATGPLGVYGSTKLEGEEAIRASGCSHLILRTSWVYAGRGNNFLMTILRLAQEREALNVVADQFSAPTGADLIADVTAHVLPAALRDSISGVYHVAAAGETNWHEYAQLIVDRARAAGLPVMTPPEAVRPVPSTAYPTPARRPCNSRLDTSRLQATFGLTPPHWKAGVTRTLTELLEAQTRPSQ